MRDAPLIDRHASSGSVFSISPAFRFGAATILVVCSLIIFTVVKTGVLITATDPVLPAPTTKPTPARPHFTPLVHALLHTSLLCHHPALSWGSPVSAQAGQTPASATPSGLVTPSRTASTSGAVQPHSEADGLRYLLTERDAEAEALNNTPPAPQLKAQQPQHNVKGVKGTVIGRAVGRAMFHGAGDGQAIKRRVHLCHLAQGQQRGIIGERSAC